MYLEQPTSVFHGQDFSNFSKIFSINSTSSKKVESPKASTCQKIFTTKNQLRSFVIHPLAGMKEGEVLL